MINTSENDLSEPNVSSFERNPRFMRTHGKRQNNISQIEISKSLKLKFDEIFQLKLTASCLFH